MSIINDALKKVQQGLNPKVEEPAAPLSGTSQKGDTYLYATPPPTETLPPTAKQISDQNRSLQNKVKSIIALICASAITAGSLWYIYQEFRQDIPRVQRLAKKSFYKLIHKEELPDFKTKLPQDLKPLAQITIPSATSATSNINSPAAGETLNIHGIMANATGTGNLALINDQVYQEGEEIDGAKIIKINLDSITVDINGTEKTIYVKN